MVEIGGQPILLHIMHHYAAYGFDDFVIACGYLGHVIKAFFSGLHLLHSDFVVNLKDGTHRVLNAGPLNWVVTLVDTGIHTMTGGRVRRLAPVVDKETFMVTYGDGLADIDIAALVRFHRAHGRIATVTGVHPPARFGSLRLKGDKVVEFQEKPPLVESWINGGFFVFEPAVFEYLLADDVPLETTPLARLAADGQLMAFRHDGFWQPMDTLRDKRRLDELWESGKVPWKRTS
jgi:glucose-1-phosphate cytidylyltransferase